MTDKPMTERQKDKAREMFKAMNEPGWVWHFMDAETVAAHGPWVRKEDHDAQLATARADALRAAAEWAGSEADVCQKSGDNIGAVAYRRVANRARALIDKETDA